MQIRRNLQNNEMSQMNNVLKGVLHEWYASDEQGFSIGGRSGGDQGVQAPTVTPETM